MLLQDKRIFIVEDNIHNRLVFTMALKMQGAQIEFDRWGRKTLFRMQAFHKIDLIILDLMLPGGVSGYDIFDEIRGIREYDDIPILAVSAAEPAVALPMTREKGFAGFIAKPIDDERFPQQIAGVIAGDQVWDAGERYFS